MEEIKVVQRLKDGDGEAFDALYEKYKNILLRMACLVSGQMDDAEDIVQETFVKCYMHIGDLKQPERFKPWLFQILYRTAYGHLKKRKREVPDEDIGIRADAADEVTSLDRIVRTETEKQVNDAVQALDIKHRMVVVMYYYNDWSTREIARALDCTEGTVKSRLFTARKKLLGALSPLRKGDREYEKKSTPYLL